MILEDMVKVDGLVRECPCHPHFVEASPFGGFWEETWSQIWISKKQPQVFCRWFKGPGVHGFSWIFMGDCLQWGYPKLELFLFSSNLGLPLRRIQGFSLELMCKSIGFCATEVPEKLN